MFVSGGSFVVVGGGGVSVDSVGVPVCQLRTYAVCHAFVVHQVLFRVPWP